MSKTIRVASLFSGIGGFEKGLDMSDLNFEVVFASEINEAAKYTYSCNFDSSTLYGDITEIKEKEIPNHDLLCAGFPCQSFSVAGKRKGFKDIRGTLFFDIIRIIKEKKPQIVLLENVKNLVSHDDGNTIKVILKNLSDCGYTFDFSIINSKEAGVPQNRERTYIVGKLNGKTEMFEEDTRSKKVNEMKLWCNRQTLRTMNFFNKVTFRNRKSYIANILEETTEPKYFVDNSKIRTFLRRMKPEDNFTERRNEIIKVFELPRNVHNDLERQRRVYSIYGILPTLLARSDSPKVYIESINRIRRITPIECFKGQGFDEKFVKNIRNKGISETQLYKQAGNAVSPPVIKTIVNKILEDLYEE